MRKVKAHTLVRWVLIRAYAALFFIRLSHLSEKRIILRYAASVAFFLQVTYNKYDRLAKEHNFLA